MATTSKKLYIEVAEKLSKKAEQVGLKNEGAEAVRGFAIACEAIAEAFAEDNPRFNANAFSLAITVDARKAGE